MRIFSLCIIVFLLFPMRINPIEYFGCHVGCEALLYGFWVDYSEVGTGQAPETVMNGDIWVGICQSFCFGYMGEYGGIAEQDQDWRIRLGLE